MKVRLGFSIFRAEVVFILVALVVAGSSRSRRVKRIANGEPVDMDAQPRVASLRDGSTWQHLCGATLLSRRHALTAAHCASAGGDYVLVLANSLLQTAVRVLSVLQHYQYDRYTRAHDIALLRINATLLPDSEWLDNNMLPKYTFGVSGDCVVYGYGASRFNSKQTYDDLHSAMVTIVSLDECEKRLGRYMAPQPDAGMLCAVGRGGADACQVPAFYIGVDGLNRMRSHGILYESVLLQGDSGGPLVCGGELQGLSSHGMSCAVPDLPAVYSSVGCHKNWIEAVVLNDTRATEFKENCQT